jgi:hypothetical protein
VEDLGKEEEEEEEDIKVDNVNPLFHFHLEEDKE